MFCMVQLVLDDALSQLSVGLASAFAKSNCSYCRQIWQWDLQFSEDDLLWFFNILTLFC